MTDDYITTEKQANIQNLKTAASGKMKNA